MILINHFKKCMNNHTFFMSKLSQPYKHLRCQILVYFIILSTLLTVIIPFPLSAATIVSDDIRIDTNWTTSDAPYIVTNNIAVYGDANSGPTLTIEPIGVYLSKVN